MSELSEPPRCPCGCGIFMVGDDWIDQHYDSERRCKLCANPIVSSKTRRITLRDGSEFPCPLCAYFVAMTQVKLHANKLVEERLKEDRYCGHRIEEAVRIVQDHVVPRLAHPNAAQASRIRDVVHEALRSLGIAVALNHERPR